MPQPTLHTRAYMLMTLESSNLRVLRNSNSRGVDVAPRIMSTSCIPLFKTHSHAQDCNFQRNHTPKQCHPSPPPKKPNQNKGMDSERVLTFCACKLRFNCFLVDMGIYQLV